jgi:putative phosphoesterase
MMRIGVVADTHSQGLPKAMLEDFRNVDFIIHAGDFCSLSDLKIFEKLGKVIGVRGNMDEPSLAAKLPEYRIIELEGVSIGITHGVGPVKTILNVMKEKFKKEKVDVVIFGHSHQAFNEKIKHILYFNPGSPTDTLRAPYRSYGILHLDQGKAVGEIIRIED